VRIHTYDDGSTQGARAFATRVGWPMVAAGSLCTIGSAQAADAPTQLLYLSCLGQSLSFTKPTRRIQWRSIICFFARFFARIHMQNAMQSQAWCCALSRAQSFSNTPSLSLNPPAAFNGGESWCCALSLAYACRPKCRSSIVLRARMRTPFLTHPPPAGSNGSQSSALSRALSHAYTRRMQYKTSTFIYIYIYTYIYMYIHICMYTLYIYIYVYICVRTHVYKHIHTSILSLSLTHTVLRALTRALSLTFAESNGNPSWCCA